MHTGLIVLVDGWSGCWLVGLGGGRDETRNKKGKYPLVWSVLGLWGN